MIEGVPTRKAQISLTVLQKVIKQIKVSSQAQKVSLTQMTQRVIHAICRKALQFNFFKTNLKYFLPPTRKILTIYDTRPLQDFNRSRRALDDN